MTFEEIGVLDSSDPSEYATMVRFCNAVGDILDGVRPGALVGASGDFFIETEAVGMDGYGTAIELCALLRMDPD